MTASPASYTRKPVGRFPRRRIHQACPRQTGRWLQPHLREGATPQPSTGGFGFSQVQQAQVRQAQQAPRPRQRQDRELRAQAVLRLIVPIPRSAARPVVAPSPRNPALPLATASIPEVPASPAAMPRPVAAISNLAANGPPEISSPAPAPAASSALAAASKAVPPDAPASFGKRFGPTPAARRARQVIRRQPRRFRRNSFAPPPQRQ